MVKEGRNSKLVFNLHNRTVGIIFYYNLTGKSVTTHSVNYLY